MNLVLIAISIVAGLVCETTGHDRPVIGILTQEISKVFELMYPKQFDSFITASYVKWIESGGARVVPIWIGKNRVYYQTLMSKINGVVLPGGHVDKIKRGGYAEAAEIIFNIASELNEQNDFFPILGAGSGMDFMLHLSNDKKDETVDCQLKALSVSLILSKEGKVVNFDIGDGK